MIADIGHVLNQHLQHVKQSIPAQTIAAQFSQRLSLQRP